MTLDSTNMLLAKIGFLAVLTLLIIVAGNAETSSYMQAVQNQFLGH